MTEVEPSAGTMLSYRFSPPGGTVVETGDFSGDGTAEMRARDLSKSNDTPIVVHRHSAHVDGWEYVTEVDERA